MKTTLRPVILVFAALAFLAFASFPAHAETKEARTKKMTSQNDAHREMFAAMNFAKLDADMNRVQTEYEKGQWTDFELRYLVSDPFLANDTAFEDLYNKWVAAYPKSYAARFARAHYYLRLTAMYITKNDQSAEAKRVSALAAQDYLASLALTPKPVLSLSQLITLYSATHDRDKLKLLYDAAIKLDPRGVVARTMYMVMLSQQGAVAEMQALAADLRKTGRDIEDIGPALDVYYARLLKDGRYQELDREINALQQDYEAGKIGDEDLEGLFNIFHVADPRAEDNFDAWIKAYPNSYAARQARCEYYLQTALVSRGEKSIKDTSDRELQGMGLYLKRASADCTAAEALAKKPILSYKNILHIAELDGDWKTRKQMLDFADIADPKNAVVRIQYLYGLQPNWGGSLKQMKDFVADAKRAGVSEHGIQAMNVWVLEVLQCDFCNGNDAISKISTVITGF